MKRSDYAQCWGVRSKTGWRATHKTATIMRVLTREVAHVVDERDQEVVADATR